MKRIKSIVTLALFLLTISISAQNKKDQKIMADAEKAKTTLLEAAPNLDGFFENSAGYVIFPNVGKGGFIIGGASGNGVVYENGTAVGMADLKKLNIGLQAGGQAIIEVIFFETDVDLERFKTEKFQFAAETSAVALKSGIAFNAKYKDGVAVFALPKAGLMADASVGGQKFGYKAF
ncbi:lipid-binding SYLF domain-containing protein [Muricauda oceani]|uniref:Lipid-binding SYLF domain-containing protein n=1 Tax=Flagellimonas oceani TaxID=2698672 RepID=A0A6G7J6P5_9FLAO|nr:lipid-binding SYLF domain-containing protein [Allomuricauda oceani]MBW8242340.1 lipid-binding SYLF domain-containing protein [Allomuricauda oceani]QII46097.1 lipid-binding SYLF domain-containing protein [Allomuricauda oceani]